MPGAGIILTALHPKDQKVYYFVQYVPSRKWIEDFGGIKEPGDSFVETAINEFLQETNNGMKFTKEKLHRMLSTSGIELKINHNRYHLFIIPVESEYLEYKPEDFGYFEVYESIPRLCMWLTKKEILEIGVHPRCKDFFTSI